MSASERPAGFSICIPSVRAATVEQAVESVRRQRRDDWELIVVMQGEDPDLRLCVDAMSDADSRIRGVWIREMGVSRARNLGIESARYDTVTFIDDDCEAAPDWLEQIHAALTDDPDVGVVAGALVAPPGPRWPISTCPSASPGDFTLRQTPSETESPEGAAFVSANLTVRRWVWDRIGAFDELLGAGSTFRGGEDLDLFVRMTRAGVPIRFLPAAVVHHTHGRRFGITAVARVVSAYGSGQGAAAAKLTHAAPPDAADGGGEAWRRYMWREALVTPLRELRPHRIARAVPRVVAFERAYRRCVRDFTVGADGLLVPAATPPG